MQVKKTSMIQFRIFDSSAAYQCWVAAKALEAATSKEGIEFNEEFISIGNLTPTDHFFFTL